MTQMTNFNEWNAALLGLGVAIPVGLWISRYLSKQSMLRKYSTLYLNNSQENACLLPNYSIILRNGTVYSGKGDKPLVGYDVAVNDEGKIAFIGKNPINSVGKVEIDSTNKYIIPGLLDIHTHYDIEVERYSGLKESLLHGVTTVLFGNCSISAALGTNKQLVELFSRVENLPSEVLEKWLSYYRSKQNPKFKEFLEANQIDHENEEDASFTVKTYMQYLDQLPIGCNIATFLGHSTIRMTTMGLERSLKVKNCSASELQTMKTYVEEAMKEGYVGLSIDLLPWHRMTGTYHGISVPSQQASIEEYRQLSSILRQYGGILQATPNAADKITAVYLQYLSAALLKHSRPLKVTMLAAMDVKKKPFAYRLTASGTWLFNTFLNSEVRMQSLATPFLLYSDGLTTPIAEEWPAGIEMMNTQGEEARAKKYKEDDEYWKKFRDQWEKERIGLFHRDLKEIFVDFVPEHPEWENRSVASIAGELNKVPIDFFIETLRAHGELFRWKTSLANHRGPQRRWLLAHPSCLPGFNDSGAHNRNMAFYDGGLRMLQESLLYPTWLPFAKALQRLTSEPANWFGLDAGVLEVGKVADIVVLDPEHLKNGLSDQGQLFVDENLGVERMVNRNDESIIQTVIVNGNIVLHENNFHKDLGNTKFGRLLRRKNIY